MYPFPFPISLNDKNFFPQPLQAFPHYQDYETTNGTLKEFHCHPPIFAPGCTAKDEDLIPHPTGEMLHGGNVASCPGPAPDQHDLFAGDVYYEGRALSFLPAG